MSMAWLYHEDRDLFELVCQCGRGLGLYVAGDARRLREAETWLCCGRLRVLW